MSAAVSSAGGAGESLIGTGFEVEVGPVAHGGHCVARHEGRVVFVRHTLPGERVRVVVTEGGSASRYLRADAVTVLRAAPGRVEPPCAHARPGLCGGCDWQHASLPVQRDLKAAVVAEQLRRLAHLDLPVVVEEVPGAPEGLGWRTRVRFTADADGRLGFRRHRSHDVVRIDSCRIASPAIDELALTAHPWPGARSVEAVVSGAGDRAVVVAPAEARAAKRPPGLPKPVAMLVQGGDGTLTALRGRKWVREVADGREWRVSGTGFWQIHPGAATTLLAAVREALDTRPGDTALDLYAGVGVFSGMLAGIVGSTGAVIAVEADRRAAADARRNLHDAPQVTVVADPVERALGMLAHPRVDVVVLDPPRVGAGREVVGAIAALRPRRIAYVACDPAALARDLATFADLGYPLAGLRAFDLFPMTAHVEVVACLARSLVAAPVAGSAP